MAYIREYSPGGGCMGFPSIKSSYAYIWWLGLLRVVQALKVIILSLPLRAGVMCCPSLIFKPSLGRREKLAEKVGRREIYRPVPPPSLHLLCGTNTIFYKLSKSKSMKFFSFSFFKYLILFAKLVESRS